MRLLFRVLLVAALAFMFRSPLQRIYQTSSHFIQTSSKAIPRIVNTRNMSSSSERPSGLIAKSGIELLTFGTPNGQKISILMEELRAAYGKEYVYQSINIMENVQKDPWYTKISPNGRIPAIVDHDRNDFAVFEGSAILAYTTRLYDPDRKISFWGDVDEESRCEQWVAWQHGGLGPMQGQSNHFYRLAKERIPYPTQRYLGETERLYGVLDTQLSSRDYLVGPGRGKYSIADIANFSWVNWSHFAGVEIAKFPHLQKWWQRIKERDAVKKGLAIPSESQLMNEAYEKKLNSGDEEFKKKHEDLVKLGEEVKEKYGYKFSSP